MKKEPVVKGVSVLRLPFGSSLTGPSKRLAQDLEDMALQCDICRNAMLWQWISWHRTHPNYQPQPLLDDEGKPKLNKNGQPVLENPYFPYCLISSTSSESLYRKGQQVCPQLAAKIVSSISQEVVAKLKAKMPYTHSGKAKFRGEAILLYEVSADNNSSRNIPVPCQDAILAYEGLFSRKTVDKATQHYGKSACLLKFPLFSEKAGRKFTNLISNLDITKLTPGQKEVVRRICKQEWKLHDSKIMSGEYKVGNKLQKGWFFNLTYIQPRKDLGLNKNNTATVFNNPKTLARPFQIRSGEAIWQLGNIGYKAEIERLTIRRKSIRFRYKTDVGKGHGKGKFYSALRPYSRSVMDAQTRFQWLLVKDIINFCIRNNCGTLVYREPSLGLREYNTWFSQHGIPFGWDKLKQKLAHKCHIHGIELVIERIRKAEYDTVFPPSKAAPVTETPVNTHVKTLQFEKAVNGKAGPLASGKVKRGIARG